MQLIEDALKRLFIEALTHFLEAIFTTVDQHIGNITGDLIVTPMSWLGGQPWNFVENVSETVILPVAGLILTFILAENLTKIVTDKRSINEIDQFELIVFTIKLGIYGIVVANCQKIVGGIFELSGELVNKTFAIISVTPTGAADISSEIATTLSENAAFNFMSVLVVIFVALLIFIINNIVVIITTLIIYGRIIEIVLYCAVAPIPFATFGSNKWDLGTNYIKSLFALMLQGVFIILVLGLYILVTNLTTTHDLSNMIGILMAMFSRLGWSVLLAGMLMKTGTISKSIMNAH